MNYQRYINIIFKSVKILLKWAWLFIVKFYQILCDTLSLLKPDKTLSSRLCFGMALLCTLFFFAHSIYLLCFSCLDVITEMERRAKNEIKIAEIVCNQAQASEDSITVESIFELLHKCGIGNEFKISLVNENDTVIACTDSTWKGSYLESNITEQHDDSVNNDSGSVSLEKIFYMHSMKDSTYVYKAQNVEGTTYKIVLSKPWNSSTNTLVDLVLRFGKVSAICLILLIVCYLIILASLRKQTRNNVQMMGELDVARNIQQQMLTNDFSAFPEAHGYDMHCKLIPAKLIGGDLYDFVLKGTKICFCVGDVSGKGTPAALFMSAARVLFRHVLNHTIDPSGIASAINNSLTEGNDSNMFITMFIGVLDTETNVLSFCNAGHNKPVVVKSDATASFLDTTPNMALGLFDDIPYKTEQLQFEDGMSLFVYTDGITEAEDINKNEFSDNRLLEVLRMNPSKSPKEINENILSSVRQHSILADQSDDITMLCIKKEPLSENQV